MAAKYEIKEAKGGKFHFVLKATNGKTIFTSQTYKAKSGAKKGVQSVQKSAAEDGRYERKIGKGDKNYFVLKAGNNQVIGQSQMYASASSMEKGINSVKKNGPGAEIADLTK